MMTLKDSIYRSLFERKWNGHCTPFPTEGLVFMIVGIIIIFRGLRSLYGDIRSKIRRLFNNDS